MLQLKQILLSLVFATGAWQMLSGGFIYAKAQMAQYLVNDAWQQTLAGQRQVAPWSWADTYPVARIIWPEHDIDLTVLQGSSGRTLAFGPGHMSNTPIPGESGNSVIGGHRDTHFSFLQQVKKQQVFTLQTADNRQISYQVVEQMIVDKDDAAAVLDQTGDLITLVTCFPFDAISSGGPLRYVVVARKMSA